MADTPRTLASLQSLLADNVAGDISAQDLRDFLVTALKVTSAQSVTTANVAAAIGTHYELTISGLTADRNFVLPAGAVGDEISVKSVTDAHDDYELILIGDTGISINNDTAATEWSRLILANETVTFRATSTTNWDVINDGRIPCWGLMQANNTTGQTTAGGAGTAIEVGNLSRTNLSGIAYTAGNPTTPTASKLTARRAGKYNAIAQYAPYSQGTSDYTSINLICSLTHTTYLPSDGSVQRVYVNASATHNLNADSSVYMTYKNSTGGLGASQWAAVSYLYLTEVL